MRNMLLQSLPPNFWSLNIADAFSLILTLALVGVYISMRNIQSEQNTIQRMQNQLMQRQTALMAADHQPRLNIEEVQGSKDDLSITLTNEGNGPADNIHSQCVVYRQSQTGKEAEFRAGFQGTGTVISSSLNPLTRRPPTSLKDDQQSNMEKAGESTINEGEHSVLFQGPIKLKPFSAGSETYEAPFSEVIQRVSREWNDVEYIAIDLFLMHTDIVGQEYARSIETYSEIELHKDLTLEECTQKGVERSRIGDPITEDEAAAIIPLTPDNLDL